jgi:hypothetical protein
VAPASVEVNSVDVRMAHSPALPNVPASSTAPTVDDPMVAVADALAVGAGIDWVAALLVGGDTVVGDGDGDEVQPASAIAATANDAIGVARELLTPRRRLGRASCCSWGVCQRHATLVRN